MKLAGSEILQRRYRELDAGKVATADIPFPDMSCDRNSLRTFQETFNAGTGNETGVFSFAVSQIPKGFNHADDPIKKYTFEAVADPIASNHAHAEVRCSLNGIYNVKREPPKSVRREFRVALGNVCKIEI